MTDHQNDLLPDLSGALKLHQSGKLDAAQAAYEAVLDDHPNHADAENLLGVLHAQQDRFTDAMTRFARATELDPGNADYWFNRGECARRLAQTDNAVDWFRTALRFRPQYKDAYSNLTTLLARSNRHEEFLELVRDGLNNNPETTEHLIQVGQELLTSRTKDTAAQLFEILHARHPDDRVVMRNLSGCLLLQGKLDEAFALLQVLTKAHPDWPDAMHLLGTCLEEMDQIDPAIAAFGRALDLAPGRIDTAFALVRTYERQRDPSAAREILDKTLREHPNEARAWARLAQHLERTSRIEEANDAAQSALRLDADNPEAHTVLVQTAAREKDFELARNRVRTSHDIVRGSRSEIRFSHAAGRVCEATGEYKEAYEYYTRANELVREMPRAQRTQSQAYLSQLRASRRAFEALQPDFSASVAPRNARAENRETKAELAPIFIVGFPRSGTTLLERLISNGPYVHMTDERPTMQRVVDRFCEITDSQYLTPDSLDQLTTENISELCAIYRDRVSSLVPQALEPGAMLVDKDPINIVHLPLIARMFPDSPLLVLLRDPRDVCLSCFTTELTVNRMTHLFTDMDDTVALYDAVMGLWWACAPALGNRALAVQYEVLVDDVNRQLPEIMSFCGLEPAEANVSGVETPTRTGDWVSTASYDSVVEPVHQRAIARWKNFEPFLEQTLAPLAPYVDRMGGYGTTK